MRNPSGPRGLILAPTRELASQIAAVLEPLAAVHNLKVTTIFGGVPQGRQVTALRSGIDVIVACPGRLEDLMKQRIVRLDTVEITIIDEADHMADLGFLPSVTRILAATPARGHRMLFSATLDNDVDKLVKRFLRDPVTHSVDAADSPVAAMTHHVFHVSGRRPRRSWYSTSPPALAAGCCSCAPSIRPASWPSSSPNQGFHRSTCTATCRSPLATVTLRLSPLARHASWWPRTSPPAASTSTLWNSSFTSTRRPTTRLICTAQAARPAPVARVTSSHWRYPSNAENCKQ